MVLDRISLQILDGQFVALLGESGSGKTTLLGALADLNEDADGLGVFEVPEKVSVLFQDARLLPWMSVLDNLVLGYGDKNLSAKNALPAHILLGRIHRVFSSLKRWAMGTFHGFREKHINAYLNEFVFVKTRGGASVFRWTLCWASASSCREPPTVTSSEILRSGVSGTRPKSWTWSPPNGWLRLAPSGEEGCR
jgi:energy-coupling factor transporter ATP-binding protein EcfA2